MCGSPFIFSVNKSGFAKAKIPDYFE